LNIIGTLLAAYWWMIPIVIVGAYLKTPSGKGFIGELIVNLSAKLMLDRSAYHLIRNVTLPTAAGTTQIDHIIVSTFGVFVIETKNYTGWIFGRANQRMWTQKIYKRSQQFQNPLHQNYGHVRTLQDLLGLESGVIHSLIVFVGDSTFKTEMPENVTTTGGYIRFIKSRKQRLLSPEQVAEIVQRIGSGRLKASLKTSKEHVQHVKRIVAAKTTPGAAPGATLAAPIAGTKRPCPKCGAALALLTMKTGANAGTRFWGCGTFPSCRFMQTIAVDTALAAE
jgi:restriction system protein